MKRNTALVAAELKKYLLTTTNKKNRRKTHLHNFLNHSYALLIRFTIQKLSSQRRLCAILQGEENHSCDGSCRDGVSVGDDLGSGTADYGERWLSVKVKRPGGGGANCWKSADIIVPRAWCYGVAYPFEARMVFVHWCKGGNLGMVSKQCRSHYLK